jgi:hypothetical protein
LSAAAREIVGQIIASGGEIWFDGDRIRGRNIPRPLAEQIKVLPVGVALVALLSTPKIASVDPGGSTPQQPAPATVHCRDCQHFTPDAINPPEGVGFCGATLTGLPPKGQRGYGCCYPSSPRACPNFQQKEPTI